MVHCQARLRPEHLHVRTVLDGRVSTRCNTGGLGPSVCLYSAYQGDSPTRLQCTKPTTKFGKIEVHYRMTTGHEDPPQRWVSLIYIHIDVLLIVHVHVKETWPSKVTGLQRASESTRESLPGGFKRLLWRGFQQRKLPLVRQTRTDQLQSDSCRIRKSGIMSLLRDVGESKNWIPALWAWGSGSEMIQVPLEVDEESRHV